MLRTNWMCSSAAAKKYFAATDYYASCPGDWLGKGAARLGLDRDADPMHFHTLADNLDPRTGQPLRPHAKEGDRVGCDLTFNSTKSVGIARELADLVGSERVEEAHREAVEFTVGLIETEMQTRVRKGGADHDRTTGNLVAYRVTHRDTRINPDDRKPDMSLHDHVFVFNATFDPVEQKWKAAQLGQIKHDAPYYEAVYHNRLAGNLRTLGMGIRRDQKAFEVEGISRKLVEKFSRRTKHIEATAAKLGITAPEAKDKLGATTRLGKATETVEDLRAYYLGRLTAEEKHALMHLPSGGYETTAREAVAYAISHSFERNSVVEEKKLYETALRYGIGSVGVDEVRDEANRQGLLVKDGLCSTQAVLAEETRILTFARQGCGTLKPLAAGVIDLTPAPDANPPRPDGPRLSREQAALVDHILGSPDRVILVQGDAGTGKTRSVRAAFDRLDCPVAMLAPTAEASRGVLRKEGFASADTVASFLLSHKRQDAVKGGVIWVDEAGLLPIRDLAKLCAIAGEQHARLILQGDPKQHAPPARSGNMLTVLHTHAHLPVGRLTEVWRQTHEGYNRLVRDIAHGDYSGALDGLAYAGWIKTVDSHAPLVDDYFAAKEQGKSVLVVSPTHKEGEAVTQAIRDRMRRDGALGKEKVVTVLEAVQWTNAQKADPFRYDGTEVLHFHRTTGGFKAGRSVRVADWKPNTPLPNPNGFAVYRPREIGLAAGDTVRVTAASKTLGGDRLNTGSRYTVKGFRGRNLVLADGRVLKPDHVTHGYVSTSHSSQGKTVDRVFVAMGAESLPAMNAQQFYVSLSRGREQAGVYTNLTPAELKEAVNRQGTKPSATELFQPMRTQDAAWRHRKRRQKREQWDHQREHEHERERHHSAAARRG